ncbi:hypothetical protein [Acinetobacter junii]|uniref:hypothetical protein n=1 Tax=Acinetobacter junii TaxID=40215 RepID=UPI000F66165A|nr:hypothetical protein [Acinetobacter junii]RSE30764.1 hypothetical protein EGT62_14710 [Acinetobacter junii]RSE36989.1 hypothetical protein EGT64_05720 [Acinetobacter junii]
MADKQYKALQPVGRFFAGDFVAGLSDKQITQLIANKVIEEVKPEKQAEPLIESKVVKTTNKEAKDNG